MRTCRTLFASMLALALATLASLPSTAVGQTTVTTDDARVVADGDYVRIDTADGVAEVTSDWRGTTVRAHDTDALLDELGAVQVDDYIQLSLAGDILFELGSAAITRAAEDVLTKVAQVIRARALGEVVVVGHTDSSGSEADNQRLSERRAVSVIRWLQRNEGIPASIMAGRGMGEHQPVAHNTTPDGHDDPAGRARNRRVELFVGTTPRADVRAAAGRVTVQSSAGEVHIDNGSVEVGGVRVDAGGVRVGGVSISSAGTVSTGGGRSGASGGSKTCAAGQICDTDCPEGGCKMTCSAGARCDYGCTGGDCEMQCAAGATCDFGCSGGDCRFVCAMASTCDTRCPGGGCTGG